MIIREIGVSSWTICIIIFRIRFYYSGNKKNGLASKILYEACTVINKHAVTETPFTISHYLKRFEGFAIRNRESFTRVFKVTI